MKNCKTLLSVVLILVILLSAAGCTVIRTEEKSGGRTEPSGEVSPPEAEPETVPETKPVDTEPAEASDSVPPEDPVPEKNGDVMILFTSDVHCGLEDGFGYAGLQQIRDTLEAKGYTTILADNGDAVQGESVGTLTKGEAVVRLMNVLSYDVAIPGNHDFDYGMEQFLKLTELAEYPYISCNLTGDGGLILPPYVIVEAAGMKIAFVGVTTPNTIVTSTPSNFQNEDGEFIYDFARDESGEALYQAVQTSVDDARADGADYVYVLGHLGMYEGDRPWTYADVIANTEGIDVFLDGHSHDTEQVTMKNKNGDPVVRSACGTKLNCIGYSLISAGKGVSETGVWSWPNDMSAPELLGLHNEADEAVRSELANLSATLDSVIARADIDLTIFDPEEKDSSGNPIRMVRRAETNLGDFCADAIRWQSGADVALTNGGGVRTDIRAGDVTYGDIIAVFPFGNSLCVVEASGQQILDALEWGARSLPDENGGFLQVSGLSYEIDVSVASSCSADENSMFAGVTGARRVKNVTVNGEALDPQKTYTVAALDYLLLQHGDGHTAFDGAKLLQDCVKLDNQVLIDYIADALGGTIGMQYADPCGDGRITIIGE